MARKNPAQTLLDIFKHIVPVVLIVTGIFVLSSALWNGYVTHIDNDEFAHAHIAYLIAHGTLSYRDFFASVYTPLFHWFLIPFFSLLGYTVSAIPTVRLVMLLMYLVRLALIYAIAKQIWNKPTAWVAVILYLWDPFTVFTGMSIRPDNLMLTFFLASVLSLIQGYKKGNNGEFWISGILAATSVLLLPKIAPSVLALMIGVLLVPHGFRKKALTGFIGGAVIVAIAFFFYLVSTGIVIQFWHQAIEKSFLLYGGHVNPVRLGFFYQPDNTWVYGFGGKPLVWIFACFLPFLGIAGWYQTIQGLLERKQTALTPVTVGLLLSLGLQGAILFTIPSVFIQYYLPLTCLFSLFGAAAIVYIYKLFKHGYSKNVLLLCACCIYVVVSYNSIQANILRGTYNSDSEQIIAMTHLYDNIPQDAHVFPSALFRPMTYPVWYGLFWGDIPESLRDQYPDMLNVLQNDNIQYVLTNSYELPFYPTQVQTYIQTNFRPAPGIESLWTRN